MKSILIPTLVSIVFLTSCHFESDKDYKNTDKVSDSTKHGDPGHQQHHESQPAHDAPPENDSVRRSASPDALRKDSASKMDSSHIGKPTSSLSKPRKGSATMADWNVDNSAKKEMDKEGIYVNTDVLPEYPGGKKAIQKFIEDNIQYPQEAIDEDVQGTVQITFAIDENGNVYKVTSAGNKIGYGLEQEALRVVKKMPKWKPGKVNGKNVKTRLSLPVVFLIS